MDSEERLNLWYRTASDVVGVFAAIDLGISSPPNLFDLSTYLSIKSTDGSVLLGEQIVLPIADPSGEPIPGRIELIRFNSALSNGTIEYSENAGTTWISVANVSGIERSLMADDGTIFNKSQDGVTYTKVVPGEWLMLSTDASMFAAVASDPGSVLLGVYDPSVTLTPPSGGSGSGGGASNPPIVNSATGVSLSGGSTVGSVRINTTYRNGVFEYTTDNGATWSDPGSTSHILDGFYNSGDDLIYVMAGQNAYTIQPGIWQWASISTSAYDTKALLSNSTALPKL